MDTIREILKRLVISSVFKAIKEKASEYYATLNNPNLTHKDSLAIGTSCFIDYIFNSDEGRDWVLENHPLILALRKDDVVFEWWGTDDLQPGFEVDANKLRVVDKTSLKRGVVKLDHSYFYIGNRPIPYMGIIPGNKIEMHEQETSRCTNDQCENHTENRWCVKWSKYHRAFRCEFCGHGAVICSQGRAECKGCNYSSMHIVVDPDVPLDE